MSPVQLRDRKIINPPDNSATDTDSDGERIRSRQSASQREAKNPTVAVSVRATKRKGPIGKGRAGGVTLLQLVEAGILQPGKEALSLDYKSKVTKADLREDGVIVHEHDGEEFLYESPSAFSIAVKRRVNPSRKADDGWKTVKHHGKLLEFYKKAFQEQDLGSKGDVPAVKRTKLMEQNNAPIHATRSQKAPTPEPELKDKADTGSSESNVELDPNARPFKSFRVDAGGPAEEYQPFAVELCSAAAMLMDVHSHMSDDEIIGILAGQWDSTSRTLRIKRAYPVKEKRVNSEMVGEMDPADLETVRTHFQAGNLRWVGSYRSRPRTPAHPSLADLKLQADQQAPSERDPLGQPPQVTAIVSPYSHTQDHGQAGMTLFQVRQDKGEGTELASDYQPYAFEFTETNSSNEDDVYVQSLREQFFGQAVNYSALTSRCADLSKSWRDGKTREQKILNAAASRVPKHWIEIQKQSFLDALRQTLLRLIHPENERAPPDDKEPEISQSTESHSELVKGASSMGTDGESHLLEITSSPFAFSPRKFSSFEHLVD